MFGYQIRCISLGLKYIVGVNLCSELIKVLPALILHNDFATAVITDFYAKRGHFLKSNFSASSLLPLFVSISRPLDEAATQMLKNTQKYCNARLKYFLRLF